MLTALIVGDIHFKKSNVRESTLLHTRLVEVASSERPDIIVLMGDLEDRHVIYDAIPHDMVIDLIEELAGISPVYILIGNHDKPNDNSGITHIHPFRAMKYCPGVYVIDHPTVYNIRGHKIVMCPYVPPGQFSTTLERAVDSEEITEMISKRDTRVPLGSEGSRWRDNTTCVLAHQEVLGGKMGNNVSTRGDKWLSEYPLLISGHLHDAHQPADNIIYVGTPYQHKFDEDPEKSISMFTFRPTGEALDRFVTMGCIDYSRREIRLDIIIRREVHMTAEEFRDWSPQDRCLTKVVITGDSQQIKELTKTRHYSDIRDSGVIIKHNSDMKRDITRVRRRIGRGPSILETVYRRIQMDEPELIDVYHDIYGKPDTHHKK